MTITKKCVLSEPATPPSLTVLQCDVYPVYRDPVHDFGILRFDPKAIKYMPVAALELRPDLARESSNIIPVKHNSSIKFAKRQ